MEEIPINKSNTSYINNPLEKYPNVALTTSKGLVFVRSLDIIYCIANNSYTNFYLEGGKRILVSKHLKKVANALPSEIFARIHESHLINLHHIVRFIYDKQCCVVMTNGEQLCVSRNRKKEFLGRFIKI